MSQKGSVEVVELLTRDGGRVLMMGRGLEGHGLDLNEHEYPLSYIWNRMQQEEGKFFLVRWEVLSKTSTYYQIPRGTEIGGHKVDMSHNHTVYNDSRAAVGNFEEISLNTTAKLILVRIFSSHPTRRSA